MNRSRKLIPQASAAGFSLIEVLIAVLVLATGLLALAALQATITRNGVDGRTRSQASAIGAELLDQIRSESTNTSAAYEGLAVTGDAWQARAWVAPNIAGAPSTPTAFQAESRVQRYVREDSAAGCGALARPCFREATDADDYETNGVSEFKQIDVRVSWSTETGDDKSVILSDVVNAGPREKAKSILTQNPDQTLGFQKPRRKRDLAEFRQLGIIPIGVGDDRESAASNPRPVLSRERGRSDETTFQVQTYAIEGGSAVILRVIDTRVLGCRCLYGSGAAIATNEFLSIPVEPTFWNGSDYVEPEEGEPGVGIRGAANDSYEDLQSNLCSTCCQDHHDIVGQVTKFDPFRTSEAQHRHYGDPDDNGELDLVSTMGKEYFEVCRFIRVNGVERVATDARLRFMNQLATTSNLTASEPESTAVESYKSMVESYVGQFAISPATAPDLSGYISSVLDNPALYTFSTLNARKFLHNRGLYVDHLEPDAIAAINKAKASCSSSSDPATVAACVIPYLPLVSLNATDIAQWSDGGSPVASVTGFGYNPYYDPPGPTGPTPISRGLTTSLAPGDTSISSRMQLSNSGISDSLPIDPSDESESQTDAQPVKVEIATSVACEATPSVFQLLQAGVADSSRMGASWVNPNPVSPACAALGISASCDRAEHGSSVPFPITCNTNFTLPANSEALVGGYVHQVDVAIRNPCTNSGSRTFKQSYCRNYAVTSVGVTVGGSAVTLSGPIGTGYRGTNGELDEEVLITLPGLPNNAKVTVNFGQEGSDVLVGENYCDTSSTPSVVKWRTMDADGTGDCN